MKKSTLEKLKSTLPEKIVEEIETKVRIQMDINQEISERSSFEDVAKSLEITGDELSDWIGDFASKMSKIEIAVGRQIIYTRNHPPENQS